jgi:NAD(P)-dependent dehydrogenase (short-subunit alcohol dehydrogenase family)
MILTGKRALITGGTKGIGAAIAIDLARQGCDVATNGRHDDASMAAVRRQVEAAGRKCISVIADVSKPEDIDRLVGDAEAGLGGLDILVHSAGGPSLGRIDDCSPEQWKETFDVHVHAAYFLCRRALPTMRKAGEAAIVFISSVAGIRGVPTHIAYGVVARDEADHNIRVNCVAPGIIRTRFHDTMTPEAKAHNLAMRIPLHREGTPEDVAEAVRMLVTNNFITGEVVVVDGGTSMQVCR